MYLDGVGIAIVHRTAGKNPRPDEPGMELSAGNRVGGRPPPDAGGFFERRGYRPDSH